MKRPVMNEYKTMTYEETIEELKFAIKHNIDFFKHNINKILDKETVEKIAEELGIDVEYKAVFLDDTRAYYTLGFYTNTVRSYFATYFSKDIISQNDNYTIDGSKYEQQYGC